MRTDRNSGRLGGCGVCLPVAFTWEVVGYTPQIPNPPGTLTPLPPIP